MGARPSSFKRGGGFLNNVDGVIQDYQFFVGDTVTVKSGNRKGEDFTPLSLEVHFLQDGAEEAVTKRLLIGEATLFGDVTDEGHVLQTPEGQNIAAGSEAGIFISSLCGPVGEGAGFDETRFSEDTESIDFRPIIGTRVRLVQVVNEAKTLRQGKQVGKDGQQYDRKDLKVQEVYSMPAVKGKTAAKVAGKPNGKVAASDVDEAAAELLRSFVSAGPVKKSQLSVRVLKANPTNREAIKTLILSEAFLASEQGWSYDSKTGEIAGA